MYRINTCLSSAVYLIATVLMLAWPHAVRAADGPELYGLPGRLRTLPDTRLLLKEKNLQDSETAGVLLYWLAKERKTPSQPSQGLGGPIDSEYIQVQLLQLLGHFPQALEEALDVQGLDPGMHDAITIALGLSGDRRRTHDLIAILKTSSEGHFRVLAAEALGFNLQAKEAIPALRGALNDRYSVLMPPPDVRGPDDPDESYTVYPVRATVLAALSLLRQLAPSQRNDVVEAYEKTMAKARNDRARKPVPQWALSAITVQNMR